MNESRILDASINRSAEGLRVMEDIARFYFDNEKISSETRSLRHDIRNIFKGREDLLLSRDSLSDVGLRISGETGADSRKNIKDTVLSNSKRVQEAFRTTEEILKAKEEYKAGKKVELLRFAVYRLEAEILALFRKTFPDGIYGILGENFSLGRTNAEVAEQMADSGVDIIQYREKLKDKSLKQIFEECREIRKITEKAGIPFIVNDYPDIALMVGADGIHQGQDDLPVKEVRKIAKNMMIGCSTHSPAQARKAVEEGADYIGVGPIFSTETKEDVCAPVGLEYLEHVAKNYDIPFVAIGGIKLHNLERVLSGGAKTVCLVTEIISSKNIGKNIKRINKILGRI